MDSQFDWWTQIVKLSEFNGMPEIVIMAKSFLKLGFPAAKGVISLLAHEKFNHKPRFDKGFLALALGLHLQMGQKTSIGHGTEHVTRMAAACPES